MILANVSHANSRELREWWASIPAVSRQQLLDLFDPRLEAFFWPLEGDGDPPQVLGDLSLIDGAADGLDDDFDWEDDWREYLVEHPLRSNHWEGVIEGVILMSQLPDLHRWVGGGWDRISEWNLTAFEEWEMPPSIWHRAFQGYDPSEPV